LISASSSRRSPSLPRTRARERSRSTSVRQQRHSGRASIGGGAIVGDCSVLVRAILARLLCKFVLMSNPAAMCADASQSPSAYTTWTTMASSPTLISITCSRQWCVDCCECCCRTEAAGMPAPLWAVMRSVWDRRTAGLHGVRTTDVVEMRVVGVRTLRWRSLRTTLAATEHRSDVTACFLWPPLSRASFSLASQVGSNLNDVQLQQLVDRTIIQGDKDKDGKLSYEVRQREGTVRGERQRWRGDVRAVARQQRACGRAGERGMTDAAAVHVLISARLALARCAVRPSCVGVQGHGEGRRAGAEAQD